MKKIIGAFIILLGFQSIQAQDFEKVKTSILITKFENAKSEFEKILTKKPTLKETAEAYYWKSRIYSGINKETSLAAKYPDAFDQIKSALDEYIKADKTLAIAKENGQDPFFDVYVKSFKDGVTAFNTKNWKVAAQNFDQAVYYSDIVFTQGWASSKQKFDTTSIIYAGYANQNAGNIDPTIVYYRRLVDSKITTPELIEVYRFLLLQLTLKKDKVNFDTYYAIAEAAYPKESWVEYKTEYIDKNLNTEEKIKLYDQTVATGKLTELELQMYGEMFMAGKNADGVNAEKGDYYISKAAEAYKKAFSMNTKNFAAAFNVGISYYNQFTILDEKAGDNIRALQNLNANKPAAPKDPKKKIAMEAQFKAQQDSIKKLNVVLEAPIKEKVDAAVEWIEKAFAVIKDKDKLERAEKNVASRSVDFLATLYGYKRDKVRGKDQKAYDEFDAKYNAYDKLHEKYQ
jgi:hypothetical protein